MCEATPLGCSGSVCRSRPDYGSSQGLRLFYSCFSLQARPFPFHRRWARPIAFTRGIDRNTVSITLAVERKRFWVAPRRRSRSLTAAHAGLSAQPQISLVPRPLPKGVWARGYYRIARGNDFRVVLRRVWLARLTCSQIFPPIRSSIACGMQKRCLTSPTHFRKSGSGLRDSGPYLVRPAPNLLA